MALKGWIPGKATGSGKRDGRSRTPTEVHGAAAPARLPREPSLGALGEERLGAAADHAEHLGPYRPLIAAIREELELFAANQLRLHLAIAERDRYVLASIEVECEGSDEERALMRRFVREFRPEQIKHYLAKEVIAGLRNASAIDLSQFAGLNAEREADGADSDEERYGELIAELTRDVPRSAARPYRVTLLGRWSELDAPAAATQGRSGGSEGTRTPLAARAVAVDIEDGGGARRVELTAVVPGRRYAIGKGEGCDIVVDGVYASRRHCEIWLQDGLWWVADAGSTNGIRIESANTTTAGNQADARAPARSQAMALAPGAWLVLSAHAQGEPRQYPRLSLRSIEASTDTRPAGAAESATATPVTPIASPRRRERAWTITARMASGIRTVDLRAGVLPFSVGRSRNQALVIDRAHAEVSGRHFEIVALDESGATVVVHGDNGVRVDGSAYGAGAELRWKPGQTMQLGPAQGDGQADICLLTLSRAA